MADRVEWVVADLLNPPALLEAMDGVKQVYHCAAKVSYQPVHFNEMKRINVEGTANIVNMALEAKIEKLLHVSSVAALGRNPQSPHVDETTPWMDSPTNTHYAISKLLAEREVQRGIAEGLNAVIVNPSIVLGKSNWDESSGRLISRVYEGLRYYTNGVKGYVDVQDVVNIMVELMNSSITGERFIVAAVNLTYKDFFAQVARYLGVPPPTTLANGWMGEVAWRMETVKSWFSRRPPLITRETAHMPRALLLRPHQSGHRLELPF